MLHAHITRRFTTSILLVVLISLACLSGYLLHFFYQNTMASEQATLLLNARIIDTTLSDKLYQKDPQLAGIADEISRQTSLRITILDNNGAVLADTSEPADKLDNHLNREEVRQALSGASGYGSSIRYSNTLHENLMYAAIPVYRDDTLIGIIRTSTSLAPAEQAYRQIVRSIAAALLMALAASLALAFWLARRQLRPILLMNHDAQKITEGNLSHRIQLRTGDEFDILALTINKLTASLAAKIKEAQADAHKFSLILEQMDNAVMLIDPQGKIIEANRKACELFHIQESMLPHHSIHLIGSALLSEKARQIMKSNRAEAFTLQYETHTFDVFLSAFQNQEDLAVLAVFHDISVLQELNQRQAEFTGNAAHELATPLTSISGFAEILREDDFTSPDDSHHYADVIYRQAQRMTRLIQELLQLTRLENKTYQAQIPQKIVNGNELLQAAAGSLQKKASAKNQQLKLVFSSEPPTIKAAQDLMEQVLRNLIDNAIKYTPERGCITASCQTDTERVWFTIQDTGIGIPEESLPRIFDRFYRVDKARARKTGGNGIGLSLVKFLVELFDGTIQVKSIPEKGTTFTLTFSYVSACESVPPSPDK